MRSPLGDPAVVNVEYLSCPLYGAQAMGNDDGGCRAKELVKRALYHDFGDGIDIGSRFIEDEDLRRAENRTGNGEELALSD